jgi:hypothetical protein
MGDLDEQIERLKRCEYLKESEVKVLCEKAKVPFGNSWLAPLSSSCANYLTSRHPCAQ